MEAILISILIAAVLSLIPMWAVKRMAYQPLSREEFAERARLFGVSSGLTFTSGLPITVAVASADMAERLQMVVTEGELPPLRSLIRFPEFDEGMVVWASGICPFEETEPKANCRNCGAASFKGGRCEYCGSGQ